jgi:hypothetical protein
MLFLVLNNFFIFALCSIFPWFCRDALFAGLVCNSTPFFETSADGSPFGGTFVQRVQSAGLALITWGDMNTHADAYARQVGWGVDGVISDNLDDLVPVLGSRASPNLVKSEDPRRPSLKSSPVPLSDAIIATGDGTLSTEKRL